MPVVVKLERPPDLSIQSLLSSWSGGTSEERVDLFLEGFERVAEAGGWGEEHKRVVLLLKVKGEAEVFLRGVGHSKSYGELKAALLGRFKVDRSKVDIRREMFTMKQRVGEGGRQFLDRVREMGVRAAGAGEAIGEELLRDIFIEGLVGNLGSLIRFDPPKTLDLVLEKIRRVEREGGQALGLVGAARGAPPVATRMEAGVGSSSSGGACCCVSAQRGGRQGLSKNTVRCFRCSEYGHVASRCPGLRCYVCDGRGHLARDCPRRVKGDSQGGVMRCFGCGESGHMARDCPRKTRTAAPKDTASGGENKAEQSGASQQHPKESRP